MISGVPLFRGRDNQDQLLHIMRIIGSPDDRTLRKISADSVGILTIMRFDIGPDCCAKPEIVIKQFPRYPKIPFQQVLPKASPQGELISSSLNVRY